MRRSTIAVFLLLVPPSSALGCYDEHKVGWFNEMPIRSWELPEASPEGGRWEEMSGLWAIAAGTASLALMAVSFRAYSRARDKDVMPALEPAAPAPLALPHDWPGGRTIRVDRGHESEEPTRVGQEAMCILCAVAAGAD
jgi:hypothetical protein